MKYLDRIGLIGAINTVLITIIPYFTLFFKWEEYVKTRVEQTVILTTIIAIALLTLFFSRRRLRNIARVEGFAYGYFYNFIYELADLINDKEANISIGGNQIKTAENDKEKGEEAIKKYQDEYTNAEIKILIIIPDDLHAAYRLSEIMAGIFDKAVISPAKNSYLSIRDKHMKAFEVRKDGKRLLLLIDTPPTTMRAIKLYQESRYHIDHNDAFKDLNEKAKKNFNRIRVFGEKNIAPQFKRSLFDIIENLTKGAKHHTYKELIEVMTLNELTSMIMDKRQYEELAFIGDNLSKESTREKENTTAFINNHITKFLQRLTDIMVTRHF